MDSWGFSCPSVGTAPPEMAVKDSFKFYLERSVLRESFNKSAASGTVRDVELWYTHFLGALYRHILAQLEKYWSVDRNSTKIEYVFSLPTSWKDKIKLIERFKKIIRQAGFGVGDNCSVTVVLTESEATAIYTAYTKTQEHNEFKVSKIRANIVASHR
jgi:hypothetical protein